MIKSDIKRNSADTHTDTALLSVFLLLANTKHAQIASLYLYLHPQPCAKTPPTLFSPPLYLSMPNTHTHTYTHNHTGDTAGDVKHLFGGRAQFLQSC